MRDYVLQILGQLQRYYCLILIHMVFSFSGIIPKAISICSLASCHDLGLFIFYLNFNVKVAILLMTCIHVPTNPLYYRFGSFGGWRTVHSMFLLEGSNDFALDAVGLMLKEWLEKIVLLESFIIFYFFFFFLIRLQYF